MIYYVFSKLIVYIEFWLLINKLIIIDELLLIVNWLKWKLWNNS